MIMTVKKAITFIDLLVENKKEFKSGIMDLLFKWGYDGQDVMNRNAKMFVSMIQNDIEWLQGIKKELLPEQHLTKIICSHPKKDHDVDPNGQKYCMNCNANLKKENGQTGSFIASILFFL